MIPKQKNKLFAVWFAEEFSVVAKTEEEAKQKVQKWLNIDKEKFEGFNFEIGEIDTRFEKQPLRRADIK